MQRKPFRLLESLRVRVEVPARAPAFCVATARVRLAIRAYVHSDMATKREIMLVTLRSDAVELIEGPKLPCC